MAKIQPPEYKTILDNLQDIVLSFNTSSDPVITFANLAFYDHLFIDRKMPSDLSFKLFNSIHPDDRSDFKANLVPSTPRRQLVRLVRSDGSIITYNAIFTDLVSKDVKKATTQVVMRKIEEANLAEPRNSSSIFVDQRAQRIVKEIEIIADIGKTLGQDLDLLEIYTNLGEAARRMFPDASVFFISRYLPELKKIALVFGMVEDEVLDVGEIPYAELDHSPQGTQTKVILTGKLMIIPNLIAHRGGIQNLGMMVGEDDNSSVPLSSLLVPMISKNEVLGVVQVQSNQLDRFSVDDSKLLAVVANTAASHIQNSINHNKLLLAYEKTIESLGLAIELRDGETEGHSKRVANITVKLAEAVGVQDEDLVNIRRGAVLHDIGKIGITDSILLKPGPLTADERKEMQKHSLYGYNLLKHIEFLKDALDIPLSHHERWDGSGYPNGLAGEQIPIAARLFAFADVYDALSSDRVYRQGWPKSKVMEHIQNGSGSHFDPSITPIFTSLFG